MAMTPRFKPANPFGESWKPRGDRGVPLAAALSFSSKSPFPYDDWARDVKRPFALVAMPGYTPPAQTAELSRDGDFAWYDRPVAKPTIVWDAFGEMALFEMIPEVFRVDPFGDAMRVRDVVGGFWKEDPRSPSLLRTRPVRHGLPPDPVSNPYQHMLFQRRHRASLAAWAQRCSEEEARAGDSIAASAWRIVRSMYGASIDFANEMFEDDNKRRSLAERKWRESPNRPLIEASGYTSPVRFMDEAITSRAHRSFAPEAQVAEASARARVRAIPSSPSLDTVPKSTFWAKLFS